MENVSMLDFLIPYLVLLFLATIMNPFFWIGFFIVVLVRWNARRRRRDMERLIEAIRPGMTLPPETPAFEYTPAGKPNIYGPGLIAVILFIVALYAIALK
jgi:hypothetical protein